jgi:hypothetical protein
VAQLEELLTKLDKLPAGAKFRLVASKAPGATVVPGWTPTELKPLMGGVKEEHQLGEEGGYGTLHNPKNWSGLQSLQGSMSTIVRINVRSVAQTSTRSIYRGWLGSRM